MSANFGDPLALASYPISQKGPDVAYHVCVSGPASGSTDNAATLAVQGDGIYIIDVRKQL